MKSYKSLALRYIKKNISESFSIILSIVLSMSLIIGMSTLSLSAKNAEVEKVKYEGKYHVRFDELDKEQLNLLKKNSKNIKSMGVYVYYASWNYKEKIYMNLLNANEEYINFRNSKIISGRYPLKSGEIALEKWVIYNIGLKPLLNQKITMNLENINGKSKGEEEFELVGILSDSPRGKSALDAVGILNLQQDGLNRVDKKHPMDVYIEFKDGVDLNKSIKELTELIKAKKDKISINYELLEAMGELNDINWDIVIVSLFVVVLSSMIIYSIFSISMYKRIREYGMIKAVGATSGQIFKIIFCEMFGLLIISIPLGAIGGYLGAWGLQRITTGLFTDSYINSGQIVFSISSFVVSILVALISITVSTAKISSFIWKTPAVDITTEGFEQKKTRNIKKHRSLNNMDITYKIINRNIIKNNKKFWTMVLSMSLGGVLFISANFYNDAISRNIDIKQNSSKFNADYEVFINPVIPLFQGFSKKDVKDIENINGIKEVIPIQKLYGQLLLDKKDIADMEYFDNINNSRYYKEVLKGIIKQDKYSDKYILENNLWGYTDQQIKSLKDYLVEGRLDDNMFEKEDKVIIYMPKGKNGYVGNISVGDEIQIRFKKDGVLISQREENFREPGKHNDYVNKTLKVGAIVSTLPTKDIYYVMDNSIDVIIPINKFYELTKCDKYRMIKINKYKNVSHEIINEKLLEKINKINGSYILDYSQERENIKTLNEERKISIYSIVLVVFLISFINVINEINHNFLSRAKEFNMMIAVGLTNTQFNNMIRYEGIFYGLISSIITCLASVIAEIFIYNYLKGRQILVNPKFIFNFNAYIVIIVINLSIGILSTHISSRVIRKTR